MTTTAELAKDIALLALDVDGILSDGSIYYTAQGDEIKAFNIMDGLGIKLLQHAGIEVAIITGRVSPMVARRARELGIKHLVQGREDKLTALHELLKITGISADRVAYMGDDLPDLAAIKTAKLGVTVPNAMPFVQQHADHITSRAGGKGAVREVCELILAAQGKLEDQLHKFLGE